MVKNDYFSEMEGKQDNWMEVLYGNCTEVLQWKRMKRKIDWIDTLGAPFISSSKGRERQDSKTEINDEQIWTGGGTSSGIPRSVMVTACVWRREVGGEALQRVVAVFVVK